LPSGSWNDCRATTRAGRFLHKQSVPLSVTCPEPQNAAEAHTMGNRNADKD